MTPALTAILDREFIFRRPAWSTPVDWPSKSNTIRLLLKTATNLSSSPPGPAKPYVSLRRIGISYKNDNFYFRHEKLHRSLFSHWSRWELAFALTEIPGAVVNPDAVAVSFGDIQKLLTDSDS